MQNISSGQQKKRFLVLPPISIAYFLVSALVIAAAAFLVDRVLLPGLEDRGSLAGNDWSKDNQTIYEFLKQRNLANEDDPVWRSSTFPVSKEHPGKKRILVMGDSYVYGDGCSNLNDIWWRQLQFELERRGYNNVEVIGAGLCGASTHRQLDWARKLLPEYKPDMIVWGYVNNDPEEGSNQSGQGIVKQIKLPEDKSFDNFWSQTSKIFPNFTQQLSALRAQKLTHKYSGEKYGYEYGVWVDKILQGQNFEEYKNTIKNLADFVKESKTPSSMVSLCMPFEPASRLASVKALFSAAGLDFHTLTEAMQPWYARLITRRLVQGPFALAVNPANGHPNVTANHFYAVSTADILEKSYPQVLGEKSEPLKESDAKIKVNDFVPPIIAASNPKPNIFAMYYPVHDNEFLHMPIRRPFVQLDLERPSAIKEVHIAGNNLKGCSLALRARDPSISDQVVEIHDLGSKKGGGCTFKLKGERWNAGVDEILVTANIEGPDRLVLVELVPQ